MKNLNTNYKLSIITINFNNLDGLKRTVESVIHQTWKNFEYIIIDGASTDGSKEYIVGMKQHFNYWVSEQDKGIFNAMNKGIRIATGDYLMFLNSGDWLVNEHVLSRVSCQDFIDDIYYGNVITVDQKGIEKNISFENCVKEDWLLAGGMINHQSAFWKSSIFKDRLYDDRYTLIADWAFLMDSVFIYKRTLIYIDEFISYYHNVGRSTGNEGRRIIQMEKTLFFKEQFETYWGILQESQSRLYKTNLALRIQKSGTNPLRKLHNIWKKRKWK